MNQSNNLKGNKHMTSRRRFVKFVGIGTTATLAGCVGGNGGGNSGNDSSVNGTVGSAGNSSSGSPLLLSSFGGRYAKVMKKQLFNKFQEDTGIPTKFAQMPSGSAVISKMQRSIRAGKAPFDVFITGPSDIIRTANADLWMKFDENEFSNLKYLDESTLTKNNNGKIVGMGGQGWREVLAHNPKKVKKGKLDSWHRLWDGKYKNKLAEYNTLIGGNPLGVTAVLFFDGSKKKVPDVLKTKSGVKKVFKKLEEIKPQINIWYQSESKMLQRIQSGGIVGGVIGNDTALISKDQDVSIQPVFPKEGANFKWGSWVSPKTSDKHDKIVKFLDYSLRPEVQDRVARNLHDAPVIKRKYSKLSSKEYNKIAGPPSIEHIRPPFEVYTGQIDAYSRQWLFNQWSEFLGSE